MKLVTLISLLVLNVTAYCQDNGDVKFKYPNGQISSEGTMKDGKPEGYWKTYYEDGRLKSEGNRKNFVLDGVWKFYTQDGMIAQSIEYGDGNKNGLRTNFYVDGTRKRQEQFIKDVLFKEILVFYPSGRVNEQIPIDTLGKGKQHGIGYEFSDNDGRITAIVKYRNGYVAGRERINRKDKFNRKQGIWKSFYDSKKEKEVGRFRSDQKHGYFKTYDLEGNLLETLKYQEGILIPDPEELSKLDIKREYHPNAQVKSVGSYNKGVKEGVHRKYTLEGKVESAKIYSRGKITGVGIVDAEGKRQGKWKEYYASGELRSEGEYINGKRLGDWMFYYEDGKEEQQGSYHKGKPDGDWKWTYPNGNTWREEVFYEGLEEGLAIEYNDTGKVVSKGEYLDGDKEGKWIMDLGDHREEGEYVAGERNGIWKHYYVSGKLKFEGKFAQGNEEGSHTYYYENGKVKKAGRYKFGLKEGDWIAYFEDGEEKGITTYKQGKTVKVDGKKVDFKLEEDVQ